MRYVLALALLLGAAVYWQSPKVLVNSSEETPSTINSSSSTAALAVNDVTELEFSESKRVRLQMQYKQQAEQFQALLKQAQKNQQGNIQPWLKKVWHQCSVKDEKACQRFLENLSPYLTSTEQHWLTQAIENFGQYYAEMTELTLSNGMTAQQRFESIEHIRAKHFNEQTNAVFGLEHAYAEYQFNVDYLRKVEASQLSAQQRLDALEQLRKDTQLGNNKEELLGPDKAYQEAVSLLHDLPKNERKKWQAQLRQQYFGDEAEKVAAYEKRQQEQQQQQLNYQQALEQLKQRADSLGGINSSQYQQELQALRQHFFN